MQNSKELFQITNKISTNFYGEIIELGRKITWTDPSDPSNVIPKMPNSSDLTFGKKTPLINTKYNFINFNTSYKLKENTTKFLNIIKKYNNDVNKNKSTKHYNFFINFNNKFINYTNNKYFNIYYNFSNDIYTNDPNNKRFKNSNNNYGDKITKYYNFFNNKVIINNYQYNNYNINNTASNFKQKYYKFFEINFNNKNNEEINFKNSDFDNFDYTNTIRIKEDEPAKLGVNGIIINDKIDHKKNFHRPVNFDDLAPIQFETRLQQKMFKNLCIPSAMHAYSVGVEFFKQWVLNKFDPKYFKTIYVDGKHLFDEFSKLNELDLIKKGKPAIGFFPNIDLDYNREGIEAQTYDLMYYAKTFDNRDAFFKDNENRLFISIALEQYLMNFNIKIKVNTKAKQLDLAKYLKIALKIGATSGYYLDLDMHVPYELLFTLAEQAGFEVDYSTGQIKDPFKFLFYLNSKSDVPFIYKLRFINGKNEFFVRAPNMYAHINVQDLSIDDGERQNQVSSNYFIEMSAKLLMPAPKIYCLFTNNRTETISMIDKNGDIKSYIANFTNVPTVNERGWEQFITLDYEEENRSIPLVIDLNEIFKGENNIYSLINYNKYNLISPSTFIDFKIFNNNKEWKYSIDWERMILYTETNVDFQLSEIVVYIDKNYINTQTLTMNNDANYRVSYNKTAGNNTNESFSSQEKTHSATLGLFNKK